MFQHILDVVRHSPHSTCHVSREHSSLSECSLISFSVYVKFLTLCSDKNFYFKVPSFFFFFLWFPLSYSKSSFQILYKNKLCKQELEDSQSFGWEVNEEQQA